MKRLLALSNAASGALRAVAGGAIWLMPILALVICIDVVTRKLGIYIPILTSSRLQELEWHLHTALFSCWLGFAYVVNAHPRVDSWTAKQSFRRKAWFELAGCIAFALPYAFVLVRYGLPFAWKSFETGEGPATVGGIPQPWIIKAIFVAGLIFLLLSVASMALRLVVFLAGGPLSSAARPPLDGPGQTV
jgi:TRAP-type mannitol/chloroaromatic compound transport system permease small subunit